MRALVISPILLGTVVLAASLAGCPAPSTGSGGSAKKPTTPAGDPIAKVGDTTLTVEQIQKKLDEQSPFVRVRYTDPAKKKEFLESQVRFEVLAAEAFARGMDQDPEVLEATKKIIVQKLTRDEFDGRVKLTDVTDADLEKYFKEHEAEYQKPEMVRASHIAIAFGADKAAAKKKAEEAQKKANDKEKLKDRNHFKELVAATSTDEATKRAGGDLRYLSAAELDEKVGTAAREWLFSSANINELSPVIEGKDAWHVFLRTGKRPAVTRTFDQVKNQIKNVVFREKRTAAFNALVDDLKKKHGVTVYEDKLEKVKVNAQMPPGGMDDGHGHGAPHGSVPVPPGMDTPGDGDDHPGDPADKLDAAKDGAKDGTKDDAKDDAKEEP
jgi:peptidyl-prolyl cis-trans isomerase C